MQAGAALGSEVASQTRKHFRRRLLLIGCAAQARWRPCSSPVAAIVFAVEVIMIDLTASSLVPILLASLASLLTAFVFFEGEDILTVPTLAVSGKQVALVHPPGHRNRVGIRVSFPSSTS